MKILRTLATAAALAAAAIYATGGGLPGQDQPAVPGPSAEPTTSSLGDVNVVDARPTAPGYDRDCSRGHACVFGPAWSDDVDVPGGHNGCDTRNDVLRRDLSNVVLKPGTQGCVVLTGVLVDPYTGGQVAFDRTRDASEVQIDHVVPLAAAWDHGAASWDPELRQAFANDPANLKAATGAVNQSKGDQTPAEWMPDRDRCGYARTYLAVVDAYDLSISRDDAGALQDALAAC